MNITRSRQLQLIAVLLMLWALYHVYIILPGYILAPAHALKNQYLLLDTILKLDFGRFLARLIQLFFVITIYAVLMDRTTLKKRLQELLRLPKQKTIFLFTSIVPCLFIVLEFVCAWKFDWVTHIKYHTTYLLPLAFYGLIMLCTSIAEELAFRGIAVAALENFVGSYTAVGIQAFYFGFSHWYGTGDLLYASSTMCAGLLLGCMVIQTRSLWTAIVLHWSWNFSQILLYSKSIVSFVITNHYWIGNRTTPDEEGLFSGVSTCIIFIMWLLFYHYHRLNKLANSRLQKL